MAPFSFLHFIRDQWTALPDISTYQTDLSGKTVIVTGANIGLGLEAARHLARMNPGRLILACRDEKKGREAVESIVKDTSCATVECWKLDLADFDSVKAFAERFGKEGGGKLDILIENAAVATQNYRKTKDGWESTVQVNHLGTALLALRLLPYLSAAPLSPPAPRLVIISSEVHLLVRDLKEARAPKILEMLSDEKHCKEKGIMGSRYSVSKLLNVLFTLSLASRIPTTSPLTVNTVNPGFCHSALTREIGNPLFALFKLIMCRTTEVGSRTYVHAAVGKDLQGVSGKYLNACRVAEPSDLVIGKDGKGLQQRVWDETLDILTQVDPKVPEIVREYLS